MEWLTRVGDRVTSLVPRVDVVAPSPSGALLAVFLTRAANPDLVRRERVYVIERATGREVVALDGPEIFRALAWVGDDALLVLREHDAGGLWATLHAVPDGGAEAETHLADTGGGAMALDVTVDHRRAFVRPIWRSGPRRRPDAVVLALPSLTTLLRVDPERFRDPSAPSVASLSPEGTRVVVTESRVIALTVDSPDAAPPTHPLSEQQPLSSAVTWVGRDRAWVTTATLNARGDPAHTYALDLASRGWETVFTEGLSKTFPKALRVDADGQRVAGISEARGARPPERPRLAVVDALSGEVSSARPLAGFLLAVCWTRDDAAIVSASARAASLEVHRWRAEGGDPDLLTRVSADAMRVTVEASLVGDDAVLLTPTDPAGGALASLVSLRP
ncbi:MAG: hypothetical protein R3A52_09660 [Polyangiales bacterium]